MVFTRSFEDVPMEYGYPNFDAQDQYLSIGYEWKPKMKRNPIISINYAFTRPTIDIIYYGNPHSTSTGVGGGHIASHSINSVIMYPILGKKNVKLYIGGGLRMVYIDRTFEGVNGLILGSFAYPYSGRTEIYTFPGLKIQPQITSEFEIRLCKWFALSLGTNFTYGFSKHQELHFIHSLYDVPQTTAINYTNGTAFWVNCGIKVRLHK